MLILLSLARPTKKPDLVRLMQSDTCNRIAIGERSRAILYKPESCWMFERESRTENREQQQQVGIVLTSINNNNHNDDNDKARHTQSLVACQMERMI